MLNVLLADDNPAFRLSLRRILAKHFPFVAIVEAGNGREAAALGAMRHPQLIFMDVKFPDGNGLDLTKRIRSQQPTPLVCIVTQYDIPEYREAAKQCGADHFILKDETSEEFIVALVSNALAGRFGIGCSPTQ